MSENNDIVNRKRKIVVAFDASQTGSGEQPFTITPSFLRVAHRLADIVLNLTTVNGGAQQATFDEANPVQWYEDGKPVSRPLAFSDPKLDNGDLRLKFSDVNNSTQEMEYGFTVTVDYDGKTFTSPDPTILNLPPT
jgi:hypothetical protein